MESFIDLYNKLEIDHSDERYRVISNFTKFQLAKNAGQVPDTLEEYMSLLKYECETLARDSIMKRLFSLALSKYNLKIAEEFFNARERS